jgi:chitin-binding protein
MAKRGTNIISRRKKLTPLTLFSDNTPYHGHVFEPASRAYFAYLEGKLDVGALNQRECGKLFPQRESGLRDSYAPDDDANFKPPADGKIASAEQATGQFLDEPGTHWKKHEVRSGDLLDISWGYSTAHKTRRFNYFITKPGWDPSQKLSRAQFEEKPFFVDLYPYTPHWAYEAELMPPIPTVHTLTLPERDGYHVLLAVWEVANTGNAFYQVIDLDFIPRDVGDGPSAPTEFAAGEVKYNSVELAWNHSTGPNPISHYVIARNGIDEVRVYEPYTEWVDTNVAPLTTYHYFIYAVDNAGRASSPSPDVVVTTPSEEGEYAPPPAPTGLHSMNVTSNSAMLMWGGSSGARPLARYILSRNGQEINLPADATSYTDQGLKPETTYRYTVYAEDIDGRRSPASNEHVVNTPAQGGGDYPAWELGTSYTAGVSRVSHIGKNWEAIQSHIAHVPEWAPGIAETLWKEIN